MLSNGEPSGVFLIGLLIIRWRLSPHHSSSAIQSAVRATGAFQLAHLSLRERAPAREMMTQSIAAMIARVSARVVAPVDSHVEARRPLILATVQRPTDGGPVSSVEMPCRIRATVTCGTVYVCVARSSLVDKRPEGDKGLGSFRRPHALCRVNQPAKLAEDANHPLGGFHRGPTKACGEDEII